MSSDTETSSPGAAEPHPLDHATAQITTSGAAQHPARPVPSACVLSRVPVSVCRQFADAIGSPGRGYAEAVDAACPWIVPDGLSSAKGAEIADQAFRVEVAPLVPGQWVDEPQLVAPLSPLPIRRNHRNHDRAVRPRADIHEVGLDLDHAGASFG